MKSSSPWKDVAFALILLCLAAMIGCVGTSSGTSSSQSSNNTGGTTGTSGTSSHSVDLTWNASASQVVGYNVYRGSQSGGPYTMVNPVLEASTSFVDSNVQTGQTYYYVVTSVDSGSHESNYSNEAQAAVP